MHHNSKTSLFRPPNRDKIHRQQQNILIRTAKPGQNTSQQQNILIQAAKQGETVGKKKRVVSIDADHPLGILNLQLLQCSLDLNNLVSLNDVSNFNVVVAVDVQTAIVAAVNLLNIVLEAFQ